MRYPSGARVSQPQYGDGTVTHADEYHTTVDFDAHGPRVFATSRVSLMPSDTLAPIKVAPARRKRAVRVPAVVA